MAENINWLGGFSGGVLIGLSATLLLLLTGKIAGVSGIASSLLNKDLAFNEKLEKFLFLIGLILGAALYAIFNGGLEIIIQGNTWLLIIAGLFIGIGTRIGSGCTSGHGVCGIARLSKRSIIATCLFMVIAILTVYVMKVLGL